MIQQPNQQQFSEENIMQRTDMCSSSSLDCYDDDRINSVGKREYVNNDNDTIATTSYQDNKKRKISEAHVLSPEAEKRLLNDWNEFCATSSDQVNVLFGMLISRFTDFQSLPEHVLFQSMVSQLANSKINPNS